MAAVEGMSSVAADQAVAVITAADTPMSRGNRITEIKAEIWAGNNWNQMLSAAPIAIELLGSCAAVATNPKSGGIKLTKPVNGYQFLRGYFLHT